MERRGDGVFVVEVRSSRHRRAVATQENTPAHNGHGRERSARREKTHPKTRTQALADGDDAKVGLAGDASISEVITPLQQHLSSDAETGVLAVKAACTLAIRCSSAARKAGASPAASTSASRHSTPLLSSFVRKTCVACNTALANEGARTCFRAADEHRIARVQAALTAKTPVSASEARCCCNGVITSEMLASPARPTLASSPSARACVGVLVTFSRRALSPG